ncbi:MAG: TonB-dependent receptor [Proteobacteria bacterium]|nr:TonB-dependent receptor [Pseudomonadota bacterium]
MGNIKLFLQGGVTAILSGLLLGPAAVFAADTEDGAGALEEVVVTARKRTESLQEVPISVSAINSATMEKLGATKVRDLEHVVPNLVFSGFWDTQSSIAIRGVGDFTRNMGYEMRVGVYVDGIFAGRSGSANQELLDIDRVEVLRGPQGTLFGKNTIAGAISLTTLKPNEDFGGYVAAEYGNYNLLTVKGSLNIPLIEDKLYSKFSVIRRTRDGYVENLYAGQKDAGSIDYLIARAQFRAILGENTEAILTFDYKDDSHEAYLGEPNAGIGFDEAPEVHQLNTWLTPLNESEASAVALTIDHEFSSGYSLTSLTSYRSTEAVARWEENHSSLRLFDVTFGDDDSQFSQELRLSSPLDSRLTYVAGLFYWHQKAETDRLAISGSDLIPGVTLTVPQTGDVTTDSIAAFVHGEYHVSDDLSITGGLRYTREDKDLNYSQLGVPLFIDFVGFEDKYSDDAWTPNIGLSYKVDDDKLLYATVSRGFKSGGWNADYVVTTDIGFDAEYATSYEVGAKTEWMDNRLRLNVAGFITKYTDYQVFQFVPVEGGGLIFSLTNAGEVTTQGFEVELLAQPVNDLILTANFGYTDATFDSFKDAGGEGIDFDGNRLPLAPKTTMSLGAEYHFDISDAVGSYIRADYSYRSGMFHNPDNIKPEFYTSGYGLLSARAALLLNNSGLEVALWGKNLTDEIYDVNKWVTFLGSSSSQFGMPRTYGIELRYSF